MGLGHGSWEIPPRKDESQERILNFESARSIYELLRSHGGKEVKTAENN